MLTACTNKSQLFWIVKLVQLYRLAADSSLIEATENKLRIYMIFFYLAKEKQMKQVNITIQMSGIYINFQYICNFTR